jgi:hypothetical protein
MEFKEYAADFEVEKSTDRKKRMEEGKFEVQSFWRFHDIQ